QTMSEVVRSVQQVTDIMGEIASASSEQTKGIEQVNVAVTQMDEVTQQNAALVEQATAAAQAMADQAESLRSAVSVFRVDAAGHSGQEAMRSAVARSARGATPPKKTAVPGAKSKAISATARKALPSSSSSSSSSSHFKERELQTAGAENWETF
ncbi:MAG: methyl-accepting chemotaxis protein, partial [Paraburkholderia graminis]